MDLGLTEAQEILKTAAANFIQQESPKETLIALETTPTGVTPELLRKVAQLGWLGIVIPEAYGGEGRSYTDAAVLFEELGRGPVPGPYFSSAVLGALTVLHAGTEEQKRTILPRVASGEQMLSLAVTEPQDTPARADAPALDAAVVQQRARVIGPARHCDGCLAGAAVADDQLALALTDRNQRVDGADTGEERLLDRLTLNDGRRDVFNRTELARIDRPVRRSRQRAHRLYGS